MEDDETQSLADTAVELVSGLGQLCMLIGGTVPLVAAQQMPHTEEGIHAYLETMQQQVDAWTQELVGFAEVFDG